MTQPGATDAGLPSLKGPGIAATYSKGLYLRAHCVVRGLAINGFRQGIVIDSLGGSTVSRCHIGVDSSGTRVGFIWYPCVFIDNAPNNTIGGDVEGEGNLIASGTDAVWIRGSGATGNRVMGNIVGVSLSRAGAQTPTVSTLTMRRGTSSVELLRQPGM